MAQEDRKIEGAVILGGRTYKAGDEDKLAAAMKGRSFDRLIAKGAVSGDWSAESSSPKGPRIPTGGAKLPAVSEADMRERFEKEVADAGYTGDAAKQIVEGRMRHLRAGGDGSQVVEEEGAEETELPKLADLADYLATLTTADEVKVLQARDERKGAVEHYEARLAELEAAP